MSPKENKNTNGGATGHRQPQEHPPRGGVQHNYHDHSYEVDPSLSLPWPPGFLVNGPGANAPSCNGGHQLPFPVRLHYVLEELNKDGLSHIASWQPHGRCFIVHDREEFVHSVLPCWFAQNCYASFVRQLNIYGFKRLTHGPDKGGYYHELFLKGMRFLSYSIPRTKIKHNGCRRKASPDEEPNFYAMTPVPRKKNECSRPMSLTSMLLPQAPYMRMTGSMAGASFGHPSLSDRPLAAPSQMPNNQINSALAARHAAAFPSLSFAGSGRDFLGIDDRDLEADWVRTLLEPIVEVEDDPIISGRDPSGRSASGLSNPLSDAPVSETLYL